MNFLRTIVYAVLCTVSAFSCNAMSQWEQNRQLTLFSEEEDLEAVECALQEDLEAVKSVAQWAPVRALYHALKLGASRGQLPVVEFLLTKLPKSRRLDMEATNVALWFAASEGQLEILKFLLTTLPLQERPGMQARIEAMERAASKGNWTAVAYLLQQGADRSQLRPEQLKALYKYIVLSVQKALHVRDWHTVQQLLPTPIELPEAEREYIKQLLIPAIDREIEGVNQVYKNRRVSADVFQRTLLSLIGPAAFVYFTKFMQNR